MSETAVLNPICIFIVIIAFTLGFISVNSFFKIKNHGIFPVANLKIIMALAKTGPMLGLLGTVIGIGELFSSFSKTGEEQKVADLSHGISLALSTTFAGLIVGILGILSCYFLVSLINKKRK